MMVKKQRITTSEIKNVRAFGGDCKLVITELKRRPVTSGEIQNIRSFGAERIAVPDRAKK